MSDYKDRVMELAEEIAQDQHDGADFYDLRDSERTRIWREAEERVAAAYGL